MQFCEKLVLLREKYNMSQEDLAEKLNVSRQTISNWENGKVTVDTNKALEICRLFNVDMNYLFLDFAKSDNKSNAVRDFAQSPTNLNKPKHRILISCCLVVIIITVAAIIFASICIFQNSDDTASSTIILSVRAGLIILIIACIFSMVLTTILLILLKRK